MIYVQVNFFWYWTILAGKKILIFFTYKPDLQGYIFSELRTTEFFPLWLTSWELHRWISLLAPEIDYFIRSQYKSERPFRKGWLILTYTRWPLWYRKTWPFISRIGWISPVISIAMGHSYNLQTMKLIKCHISR